MYSAGASLPYAARAQKPTQTSSSDSVVLDALGYRVHASSSSVYHDGLEWKTTRGELPMSEPPAVPVCFQPDTRCDRSVASAGNVTNRCTVGAFTHGLPATRVLAPRTTATLTA